MLNIRKIMGWIYAITCLACLQIAVVRILKTHSLPVRAVNLLVPTEFIVQAIIFGAAWWAIFKGKSSARDWGIAASLTYVLFSLSEVILFSRPVLGARGMLFVAGIMGLFFWRNEQDDTGKDVRASAD